MPRKRSSSGSGSSMTNLQRLQTAGLIVGAVPPEYDDVIDGLSTEELDHILAFKKSLDDRREETRQDRNMVDYTTFILPP